MQNISAFARMTVVALLAASVGCSGSSTGTVVGSNFIVSISPNGATMKVGESTQLLAAVINQSVQRTFPSTSTLVDWRSWSVDNPQILEIVERAARRPEQELSQSRTWTAVGLKQGGGIPTTGEW